MNREPSTTVAAERLPGGPAGPAMAAGWPTSRLILFLLWFLGLSFGMPQFLSLPIASVSLPLIIATGLAWLGWRKMTLDATLRAYLVLAVIFSVSVVLSAISHWDSAAARWAITIGMWTAFIVPGLSVLFRDAGNRRAFVFGLGVAIAAYGAMRGLWYLTGSPLTAHDVVISEDGSIHWFLGANRNDIDIKALFVLPLLWLSSEGKRIWFRRALSVAVVFWLVTSGGRSGLALLPLMAMAYFLIVPGASRRFRTLAGLAAIVALAALAGPAFFREPTEVSIDRVSQALSGERTTSDERRAILNNRAWNLGWDNPLVGHGYGRLAGAEDPALNEARSEDVRRSLLEVGIHNRYLWLFASVGVPGTLAHLAMLGLALLSMVMLRRVPDARWVAISLIAIFVLLWFHTGHQELTDLPLALALGVAGGVAAGAARGRTG